MSMIGIIIQIDNDKSNNNDNSLTSDWVVQFDQLKTVYGMGKLLRDFDAGRGL